MKPYEYRKYDEDDGILFGGRPREGDLGWRICFIRSHGVYVGWDSDRHRFIVEKFVPREKRLKKSIRGTWRWKMYHE